MNRVSRFRRDLVASLTAALVVVGTMVAVSALAVGPAAASVPTSVVWGHTESARYHWFSAGSIIVRSSDSKERLEVTLAGDLRLQKQFACPTRGCGEEPANSYGTSGWFSYWRSHVSGDSLYLFRAESNGRLQITTDTGDVAWESSAAPGTGYNYGLQIDSLGRLREWYATGNPFGTGHHLAWSVDRVVGQEQTCTGGPMDAGTTNADFLAQNGTGITVTVHNANFVGLPATVYRYEGGDEYHAQAYVLGPYSSHTFTKGWYVLDNLPEGVNMRVSTSANNVVASYAVKGWCWYRA